MREGMRRHIAEAVAAYEERSREHWILELPAQVVLTASQIWWSADMNLTFERLAEGFEMALRDYNKKQVRIQSLVGIYGINKCSIKHTIMFMLQISRSTDIVFNILRVL